MGKVKLFNPTCSPSSPGGSSVVSTRVRQANRNGNNGSVTRAPGGSTAAPSLPNRNGTSRKTASSQGSIATLPNGNGSGPTLSDFMALQQQNFALQMQNDDYQDALDRIADIASCDDDNWRDNPEELADKLNDILDLSTDDVEADDNDQDGDGADAE